MARPTTKSVPAAKATAPTVDAELMTQVLGQPGTIYYGQSGRAKPDDELLPELRGMRGMRTLREMRDNDATIGMAIQMTMNVVRRVDWTVQEGPSGSARAKAEVEWYETVLKDMSHTWDEFLSDVLSLIWFGHAPFEKVYKRRLGKRRNPKGGTDTLFSSQYDDGRLGIAAIALRRQETIVGWAFDDNGTVVGCYQRVNGGVREAAIPRVKLVIFKTESNGNNPEGRSMIRSAYRAWYFLKRLEELEAIGLERDLTGLPWMRLPPAYLDKNSKDANKKAAYENFKTTLQQIRRNEHEGVVLPSKIDPATGKDTGFDFGLMTSGGTRAYNTNDIIGRKKHEIAGVLGASFMQLGANNAAGSKSTSEDHSTLYEVGVAALLDIVEETFDREVTQQLFEMNGVDPEDRPRACHSDVSREDLNQFVDRVCKLEAAGVLQLSDDDEDHVREKMKLPPRVGSRDEADEEMDVNANGVISSEEPPVDEEGNPLPAPPQPGAPPQPPQLPVPTKKVAAYVPPEAVRSAARAALEASKRGKRGLSKVHAARARALASGSPISVATVKRLAHTFDAVQPDRRAAGWKARGTNWQLWHAAGGDAGREWAASVLREAA